LGMYIFIREASNAHNLRDLLPLVTERNCHRFCLCTDDRNSTDLFEQGHIDHLIRMAIREGLDPMLAIRMATLNPAQWFRLHDRGAVAPGRRADLTVFESFDDLKMSLVLRGGRVVAQDGIFVRPTKPARRHTLRSSMNVDWRSLNLSIPLGGSQVRVIGMIPDQIVTEHLIWDTHAVDGQAMSDVERDMLKIAVVERHMASGNVGKGFVHGFGLQRGALASTVAHDHHNLILVGVDDTSMTTAALAVADMRGGLAVADGEQVLARLSLPVAGLMSRQPLETVVAQKREVQAAIQELGSPLKRPFAALGFLSLEVIPSLKLTDQGLVDVDQFQFVPLFVD